MLYISNKYTRWYYTIIQSAQNRRLERGIRVEKHHIIPRSLGGGNEASNLVALTPREHFVCHLLLTKMCTGKAHHSMIHAARFLARTRKGIRVSSRTYAYLKEQAAPRSEEHSRKIGEANKKKWQDPEISQKMSAGIKRAAQSKTPEERSASGKKANAALTPEDRSARSRKSAQSQTPEQHSARGKKGAETRRLNRLNAAQCSS